MPSLTQEAEPARKASSVTSGGSYRATRSLPMGRLLCAAALLLPVLLSGAQKRPHVAVIGAGFGGWGACKTLLANGCQVTLLDAIPDPSGATPYLTPTGKPFEAGTKGFWADYPNLYALIDELGLKENEVFTPCTNSSFYSPFGLEATAPVFSQSRFPILPSPLGQVLATVGLFERLPLADRASMIGLLYATIDFTRSEAAFEAYDKMTAYQLFQRFGLSKRLVDDFVRPTLLVGLFKPPEELSAAVAMELLYFYALAHQTAFDVKWIKSRSIAESIIAPLARRLHEQHGDAFKVIGGARVTGLDLDHSTPAPATATATTTGPRVTAPAAVPRVSTVTYQHQGGASATLDVDACVLALGAKGLRAVLGGSPALARAAPELTAAASLGAVDVIACRLWLDKKVATRTPANVFSRFPELRGAGGTFFMLDQLQGDTPEGERLLWGEPEHAKPGDGAGASPKGSVVACDFYNSAGLMSLSEEDIVGLLTGKRPVKGGEEGGVPTEGKGLLPQAVPAFADANVVDYHVVKYPGAVNHFSPNSFRLRPPLRISGVGNVVCAGDWVRMGDREHGAKGLCQERAWVSGVEAANALARSGVLARAAAEGAEGSGGVARGGPLRHLREAAVLPVRDDELQYQLAREVNARLFRAVQK